MGDDETSDTGNGNRRHGHGLAAQIVGAQSSRHRLAARAIVSLAAVAVAATILSTTQQATAAPTSRSAKAATTSPWHLVTIAFFNPTHGYGLFTQSSPGGTGSELAVGRTTDGGTAFGPLAVVTSYGSAADPPAYQLAFDDHGDGFLYGPGLFVTHDGGSTWTADPQPGAVLSVAALGSSVWMVETPCLTVATSSSCPLTLQQSTDGGRTWHATGTPTTASAETASDAGPPTTAGVLPAPGQPWMVRLGPSSAYLLSAASGTATSPDPTPLWSTADGGATWVARTLPCHSGSVALSAVPAGPLFAVCGGPGGAGMQQKSVYVSTDGGSTWSQRGPCSSRPGTPPARCISGPLGEGDLGVLDAVSSTTAYLIGDRGPLLTTRDGGVTWHASRTIGDQAGGPSDVVFFDAGDGIALSTATSGPPAVTLWHTAAGGGRWTPVTPRTVSSPG